MTHDITRDEFTGRDFVFCAVSDNATLHRNVTLEGGDDIGSLLFLVPTNNSVQEQNTTDNTKIDPITKTGGEEDSEFHN